MKEARSIGWLKSLMAHAHVTFLGKGALGVVFLLLTLTACRRESLAGQSGAARQSFAVTGVVKSLEADGKTVVIQHEAISNYMDAMTMPFEVKNPGELRGLRAGDAIAFQMVVTKDDGWIENISKLSNNPPPASPTDPVSVTGHSPLSFHVGHALAPLEVGDPVPDYHFTNELGQPTSLGEFKGRVIAFTFIFTRCPFPTACPRLSSNFEEVAHALASRSDAPPGWHLFSMSFDPANDTPAVLKEYAARYHYNPAQWSFLTGNLADIRDLADQFDEAFEYSGASISHTFRTVVVDAEGRVRKIIVGNTWTSDDLVREMINAVSRP